MSIPSGNFYLIGMMGAGKSAVGRELAKILNRKFADIDAMIEEKKGEKISAIFETEGEDVFRALETECLKEIASKEGFVVATGGGIVTRPENVESMKQKNGQIIFLDASLKTLKERLDGCRERPLLQVEDWQGKVAFLLNERRPEYEAAAVYTVSTDGMTAKESAERVSAAIKGKHA